MGVSGVSVGCQWDLSGDGVSVGYRGVRWGVSGASVGYVWGVTGVWGVGGVSVGVSVGRQWGMRGMSVGRQGMGGLWGWVVGVVGQQKLMSTSVAA